MEEGLDPDEARRRVLAAVAKEVVQQVLVETPNTFHYDHHQYSNFEGEELNHKIKTGGAHSQNAGEKINHSEVRSLEEYIHALPPLGLKLKKTPSAVKLINEELNKRRGTKEESEPKVNKFPAMHFPASSLRIGAFNLHKEPMFYQETDSEPQSHRAWKLTEDFTGGQAFTCRRHYLEFPPGVLKQHYEKMIQYDKRLRELSHQSFPSLESPDFGTDNPQSHAYAVLGSNNNPDRHHQQPQQFGSTIPSSLVYSTAPTSDIGSAYLFNNRILEVPNMANMIQDCHDHANIWASEGQRYGNFSNIDMCLKDSDFGQRHQAKGWKSAVPHSCHVAKINSSGTSAGLSMKVNRDYSSNYTTSTQIADLPTNTRINSMEAFTYEREEHYNSINFANRNDMVLSHQGRFKRQALHFPPLPVANYLLPHIESRLLYKTAG